MLIGLDDNTGLIYEGRSNYGHGLWPVPIFSPAVFTRKFYQQDRLPERNTPSTFKWIFREDGFDPVSRTRRGRFYGLSDHPNQEWFLQPHPALKSESNYPPGEKGEIRKRLWTSSSFSISTVLKEYEYQKPVVLLGTKDNYSIWSMINTEATATGEDLVTLKMRPTFGILPETITGNLPEKRRDKILELIRILSAEVFRAGPESVIDRARDCAAAILGAYLEENDLGKYDLDLNDQINKLKKAGDSERKRVAENAANIVRLFHARAKPSEQERRNPRRITEQDAELAVNCIATILCELDWARW